MVLFEERILLIFKKKNQKILLFLGEKNAQNVRQRYALLPEKMDSTDFSEVVRGGIFNSKPPQLCIPLPKYGNIELMWTRYSDQ